MFLRVLFLLPFLVLGRASKAETKPDLVIYAYDSFLAQGGPGAEVISRFEAKCGCHVKALASGDGGQVLSRVQLDLERGKPGAQIVLGLDQNLWERAKPFLETWKGWKPQGFAKIDKELQVGAGFLPFDYGVFAFMADTVELEKQRIPVPHSLQDLLRPAYHRKLLLEDPRTSTPGLAFLLYTRVLRSSVQVSDFWTKLRSQWLTLAPGWDSAYGLFLKGEAPLVWSYTTSQAYHRSHGDERRYRALIFDEGQPVQIEGAAIIKASITDEVQRERAHQFLEFLLTTGIQKLMAEKNWMLPVTKMELPSPFSELPKAKRLVKTRFTATESSKILNEWSKSLLESK